MALSSTFASVLASPTPMLSVIFWSRGTCIVELKPSSSFRRGRPSCSWVVFGGGLWRLVLTCRSPDGQRLGWSSQTDARAEPVRPDGGIASDASLVDLLTDRVSVGHLRRTAGQSPCVLMAASQATPHLSISWPQSARLHTRT